MNNSTIPAYILQDLGTGESICKFTREMRKFHFDAHTWDNNLFIAEL